MPKRIIWYEPVFTPCLCYTNHRRCDVYVVKITLITEEYRTKERIKAPLGRLTYYKGEMLHLRSGAE